MVLEMVNMNFGGAFGKQCGCKFQLLELMAWLMYWWLLVVVYLEIE
jgi:hypothetical protein